MGLQGVTNLTKQGVAPTGWWHAGLPGMCLALSSAGVVLAINEFGAAELGYGPDELVGRSILELCLAEDQAMVTARLLECVAEPGHVFSWDTRRLRKEHGLLEVREIARAVPHPQYGLVILTMGTDMAERSSLQMQLLGAQKMEAIGRLAGGIAHDFNNLLTAIRGFAELHLAEHPPGDPGREEVLEIDAAARRASDLTQSLLAFSRRASVNPEPLDLLAVARESVALLRRLVGEHIAVELQVGVGPFLVLADKIQVEQILLNLATNARDAMPGGGRLAVAVERMTLNGSYVERHPGSRVGRHVCLAVSDTGIGMNEEVAAHLFEPFFTTKPPGSGTGLGLATVYGIVKQAEGYIELDTHVGGGTAFRIYLPELCSATTVAVPTVLPPPAVPAEERHHTVLIVEDDPDVRHVVERTLGAHGYHVLSYANPVLALNAALDQPNAFDALVTDVVMPEMSGANLADQIAELRPDLPVLFITGYDSARGLMVPNRPILAKPFRAQALVEAVDTLFAQTCRLDEAPQDDKEPSRQVSRQAISPRPSA